MSKLNEFLFSFFFYSLAGFGISLTIKAGIGVSSFNSMNLSISQVLHIKVGTITIFVNLLFLLSYMVITRFSTPAKYVIQLIAVFCFGFVINLLTYHILSHLLITTYFSQIIVFTTGTVLAGISTGVVVYFEKITFPIEGLCLALSEITKYSFAQIRYLVDIFSILISLLLSFTFHLSFFIREGTLISLLLLSSTIHLTKQFCQKLRIR